MQNKFLLSLLAVICLGAIVRLYRFSNPVADWHSWRQADTSSVSRNFVRFGVDLLHPRFDDLSNVPSGIDNPNGYRFVEFPLFNFLQSEFYIIFGMLTLEEWGRVVSILASLGSILFLTLLCAKYAGKTTGLLCGLFYALIPYNIYYGRTILPDPSMVAAILGGIYFFDKWTEKNSRQLSSVYFLLSILLTISALLLKPYALFFTIPFFWIAWKRFGFGIVRNWQLWVFIIFSLAPLVFWRLWIKQFPEGIPVSDWLFNGGNIRFTGAYFYWLFADRIGRLILGYWGLPLFVLGIMSVVRNKSMGFFFSFLLSSLVYIIVIARGNVQHDYYQILIMPTVALFLAIGTNFLLKAPEQYFSKTVNCIVCIISALFLFGFGWYFVRDYFNINNSSIVVAGNAVDALIPKDAKIIAPYDGDTSFLYQTKRQGWASFEKPLPEMIKMGATYLVLVNPKESDLQFENSYKLIASTPQYILFDLTQK